MRCGRPSPLSHRSGCSRLPPVVNSLTGSHLTAVQRSLNSHPLALDVAGTQGWSSWPCSYSARRLPTPLVARLAPPPVARRAMSLPGKQPALSCRHRLQLAATAATAPTAFAAAQLHRHHPRNHHRRRPHPRHRHRRRHHLSRRHRHRHLPIRLCRQCRRGSS